MTTHTTTPQALIGATLLATGRPVTLGELARVLDCTKQEAHLALEHFATQLRNADIGIALEMVAGGARLVVPPELTPKLAPVLAPPPLPALSQAALEVLAIIAYRQPVTRAEIEALRGASASTVITLQERELVKVVGRSQVIGQPLLYGTTEKFLLEFGLENLDDLPQQKSGDFSHLLRS